MVDRITMNKKVSLGYGNLDDLELLGRAFGYDIYVETGLSTYKVVWVYDRNVTKRMRHIEGYMETRYRIVSKIDLTKDVGGWHVDLVNVDSRYKGNNLAVKFYCFLIRKLNITLKAGSSQSSGGRYIWNKLAKVKDITVYAKKSTYSKVIDFPKSGHRELVGKKFDLYDSKAAIFAIAS